MTKQARDSAVIVERPGALQRYAAVNRGAGAYTDPFVGLLIAARLGERAGFAGGRDDSERPAGRSRRLAPDIGDPQTDFQLRRAADFEVAADHEIRFPVIFLPRRGIGARHGASPGAESGREDGSFDAAAVVGTVLHVAEVGAPMPRRSGETIIDADGA